MEIRMLHTTAGLWAVLQRTTWFPRKLRDLCIYLSGNRCAAFGLQHFLFLIYLSGVPDVSLAQ